MLQYTIQVQQYWLEIPFKSAVEEITPKYAPSLQTPPPSSNPQSRIHLPAFLFHITTPNPSVIFVFLATSTHLQEHL